MTTARTFKIRTWDCAEQAYRPEREITLAQYRAEVDAANAEARAIHAANIERLARERGRP